MKGDSKQHARMFYHFICMLLSEDTILMSYTHETLSLTVIIIFPVFVGCLCRCFQTANVVLAVQCSFFSPAHYCTLKIKVKIKAMSISNITDHLCSPHELKSADCILMRFFSILSACADNSRTSVMPVMED